jgi:hypothetical protein
MSSTEVPKSAAAIRKMQWKANLTQDELAAYKASDAKKAKERRRAASALPTAVAAAAAKVKEKEMMTAWKAKEKEKMAAWKAKEKEKMAAAMAKKAKAATAAMEKLLIRSQANERKDMNKTHNILLKGNFTLGALLIKMAGNQSKSTNHLQTVQAKAGASVRKLVGKPPLGQVEDLEDGEIKVAEVAELAEVAEPAENAEVEVANLPRRPWTSLSKPTLSRPNSPASKTSTSRLRVST